MGVKGLSKNVFKRFIKSKTTVQNITSKNKTRGLYDLSEWVHKTKYIIAEACLENRKDDAINGAIKWLRTEFDMLKAQGVRALHGVGDGAPLLSKDPTDSKREE